MSDASASSWLNIFDTLSFCCILVAIEEWGRSVVPNGGPTMPWDWRLVFLGAGIVFSIFGRQGPRLSRTLWNFITRKTLREENTKLKTELAALEKQPHIAAVTTMRPGVPRNADQLVWNGKRMVANVQKTARDEKLSFAQALLKDPAYSDLRPYMGQAVKDAIESAKSGSAHDTGATVDPLFTVISDEINRIEKQWGLVTGPSRERAQLEIAYGSAQGGNLLVSPPGFSQELDGWMHCSAQLKNVHASATVADLEVSLEYWQEDKPSTNKRNIEKALFVDHARQFSIGILENNAPIRFTSMTYCLKADEHINVVLAVWSSSVPVQTLRQWTPGQSGTAQFPLGDALSRGIWWCRVTATAQGILQEKVLRLQVKEHTVSHFMLPPGTQGEVG
ncbi:MAG TPA: hypothetical protein VNX70_15825 [Bryobacteraceae bacterium]|jgi:hypothetical protein|nr:hypothetical protein [Bryobacteraceae bacterium]